ncbi:MAG TPA: hypothetical protein ENN46_04910 [Candidatus Woesearchaeota archaeon]|nr:hypothetical protein [Candidatus Woesearchaeota archaeon]
MQIERKKFIGLIAFRKGSEGKTYFALEYDEDESAYNFPRIEIGRLEKPLKEIKCFAEEILGKVVFAKGYKDFVEVFLYENLRDETTLFLFDASKSESVERAKESGFEFFEYSKARHLLLFKEQKDALDRAFSWVNIRKKVK